MTTRYVWSGAGGTNSGADWTNAYTAFGSAITASTGTGDIILVHYTHQEELAVDTTYTAGASNLLIESVDKDASDAFTPMGTGGWLGNSTTNRTVSFNGTDRTVLMRGITVRVSGSTIDQMNIGSSVGSDYTLEQCYLWQGNSTTNASIVLASSISAMVKLIDCTLRFGAAASGILTAGRFIMVGGSVSSAGTCPTYLFRAVTSTAIISRLIGVDLSYVTTSLVGDGVYASEFVFDRCKLGAGVVPLVAQTANPNAASSSVSLIDCSSGDTHGLFAYYDALGSMTSETGIYYTSGAAAQSWKIVTSSNACAASPFYTPWIAFYNDTLSGITPRLEILRDGSSTAYNDDEVWAEVLAKTTAGTVLPTHYSDRAGSRATPAAQAAGAGTGSWTGEGGTAWSGKIDSGSTITPAEIGELSMRACVALASATVYIDPQIRT